MMNLPAYHLNLLLCLVLFPPLWGTADPARWEVPLAGNAYLTAKADGSGDDLGGGGIRAWKDPRTVFSVFFHMDRPASVGVILPVLSAPADSTIRATIHGKAFDVVIKAGTAGDVALGQVDVAAAGYLRVDLQGVGKTGEGFVAADKLVVVSATPEAKLTCVKTNGGNMFYWGRRGPSVHLGYQIPHGKSLEYAYTEVTVPEGQDPVGSYFMANGFGEGYFGMQVLGPDNRKVLFSVWSPFSTDRPKDIPAEDRVVVLAKGQDVLARDFGGEGSGGQSFLDYPWQAGRTYRFLNSVKPDGKGNTIYTAWFGDKAKNEWHLVARFLRPKTNTTLTGYHSFLENFSDRMGYRGRRAVFANQHVRDTNGLWHEITRARFTGDGTAGGGHRLDYAGGLEAHGFYLRNGGYFNDRVPLNQIFNREPALALPPDFDDLPCVP